MSIKIFFQKKEIIIAGVIGAILTALTITYWWIVLIVGVIAIIVKCKRA